MRSANVPPSLLKRFRSAYQVVSHYSGIWAGIVQNATLSRPYPLHRLLRSYDRRTEMPVTVGAVGDIIALIQLVKDFAVALDASRGSSAEYQGAIREMQILVGVLYHTEQVVKDDAGCLELLSLALIAQSIVEESRDLIANYVDKIAKYRESLGKPPKSIGIVKTVRRVQFAVSEMDDLCTFRAKINGQITALNTILAATNVQSSKSLETNVRSDLRSMSAETRQEFSKQMTIMTAIQRQIDHNSQGLMTLNEGIVGRYYYYNDPAIHFYLRLFGGRRHFSLSSHQTGLDYS
ncbi:hypothetical protein BDV96DRAFT_192912 [Lophiotrema nucula]|uniref:Fungal N-terminal domain-containing protein n=1 Tax=Lophiotrema nucula TaxID=690887 RepID=A0A6A5YVH2_9PLEO|nr:hypothetical protein BDV96DRAFT_192912 [Lophiotrema nucula]